MENSRKLSFSYHEIPSLSVLLLQLRTSIPRQLKWKALKKKDERQISETMIILLFFPANWRNIESFICMNSYYVNQCSTTKDRKVQHTIVCKVSSQTYDQFSSYVHLMNGYNIRSVHVIMWDSWWIVIWVTSWEILFMPYVNNKGAYQPAHPRSLITIFIIRCLDNIML